MSARLSFVSVSAAALAAASLACGPAAGAEEPGREGLREVAGRIADGVRNVAGKLEQPAVRIGYFSPFGIDDSHAGGAFMAELVAALTGFVNADAALELQGSYGFIDDPAKPGLKAIVVRAKLVRLNTGLEEKEFTPFEGYIRAVTDIARILGANVSFKPDDEYKGPPSDGRNKDLQKTLPPGPGKPPEQPASIDGTLVKPTKDSPYAVEIRAEPLADFGKREAAARKAELLNGEPYVPIEKDEIYQVRALNYSDHEVAVSLAIDGLDQFTFSDDRRADGRPKFTHFIVGPCKGDKPGEVLIRGWHKTAKPLTDEDKRQGKGNELSFLVTEYGKGAASKFPTQSQGKVGTITVGFALSHPSGTKGGTETGFGPPVEVKQEPVKRDIDAPSAFVTVRYNR